MNKLRVIMTGPLPPQIGGMATVLGDLQASNMSEQVDLIFFNTGKTTSEGRSLIEAVKSKVGLWLDWIRLLKNRQKTIAHIHTCSGLTFFLDGVLVCLAKLCSVPVVLHIHGAKFDQFLDGLGKIQFFIAHWLIRRCDKVVVLSESWRVELQKRLGNQRFCVVPNGVPVDADFSKERKVNDSVNVLFLGNLTERKGVWDLIDAMEKVDNAVLHLVGGEEQIGITTQIESRIDGSKIKLHGPKAGEEKEKFLRDADIFVLPSYAEGLPISLLEAMAYGLPVVVSAVGGIPAVVKDQQEGFLIEAGNQEQLVSAMNQLVCDPELRIRMGRAARERCRSEFGIEKTVEKLLSVYWEVFPECGQV